MKLKKRVFYTEMAYIAGLVVLAVGTAFMEKADFGVSMVVAPAYILHLKISEILPFFSFGMAEYTFQAILIILTAIIMHRIKLSYLFSFITAVLYGFILDGAIWCIGLIPVGGLVSRIVIYIIGMLLCAAGVSFLFHTYIPPEAYELFVKEISEKYNIDIPKCKTVYDCVSCVFALILSFSFFGLWQFKGINVGTVICALVNGSLIGVFTKIYNKLWKFEDRYNHRGATEEKQVETRAD